MRRAASWRSIVGAGDQAQRDLPDQEVDRNQQKRDGEDQQVADLAEGAHVGQLRVDGKRQYDECAREEYATEQHGHAAFGGGPRRSIVAEVRRTLDLWLLLARRKRHCEAEWYSFPFATSGPGTL